MTDFTVKVQGIDNLKAELAKVVPKMRRRAIRNALAAGARMIRDQARSLTPVLVVPVRRNGVVIRQPGTVKRAISVRTSKQASRRGDVGVFVNVRPAKGALKGANSPKDPYYWKFIEFGTKDISARRFLQGAAQRLSAAIPIITAKLGPAIQKILDKQASE